MQMDSAGRQAWRFKSELSRIAWARRHEFTTSQMCSPRFDSSRFASTWRIQPHCTYRMRSPNQRSPRLQQLRRLPMRCPTHRTLRSTLPSPRSRCCQMTPPLLSLLSAGVLASLTGRSLGAKHLPAHASLHSFLSLVHVHPLRTALAPRPEPGAPVPSSANFMHPGSGPT